MIMKLFISADIEGTTGIARWDETENGHSRYAYFAQQMTREVSAACEGAMAAGCTEILIKDAHDSACNLIPDQLPVETRLFRGWGSDFFGMVAGLDETYDGVFFTGYHSGAGMDTNPLSHTMNRQNNFVRINGIIAPELMINSLTAAYLGVPVRLVTGDQGLCDWMHKFSPNTETVAVSEGHGRGSIAIHPKKALELIRDVLEGRGAWRIHGGGFAGTILAFVPFDMVDAYAARMDAVFGEHATTVLAIRPEGVVCIR